MNSDVTERNSTRGTLDESYCVNKFDGNAFQQTYQIIDKYQWKDKELLEKLKCTNYDTKYFSGGGKVIFNT